MAALRRPARLAIRPIARTRMPTPTRDQKTANDTVAPLMLLPPREPPPYLS